MTESELERGVRRGLIVLAVLVFVVPSILYLAPGLFLAYAIRGADPFPAFMADYAPKGSRTYDEAKRAFPDFIARTFPIGSDKNDAVAQLTKGGFEITGSTSEAVKLR